MDLQADEAIGVIDGRIRLGVVQGRLAVEEDRDAGTFGPDLILVPLSHLLEFSYFGLGLHSVGTYPAAGTSQELLATGFVIERSGMAMTDVGLIADHLVGRIGRALAPELHAAVHEAFGAGQLIFKGQAEVIKAALGREELIARIAQQGAAHDLTVLDPPDLGVAVPAGQRLAVEERDRRGAQAEDAGEEAKDRNEALHGVTD